MSQRPTQLRGWLARGAIAAVLSASIGCRPKTMSLPVHFVAAPAEIDGAADEPGWGQATPLPLSAVRDYGRARLMWDSNFLYAIMECPLADRITGDSLILKVAGRRRLHFKFEPDGNCWDLRAAAPRSALAMSHLLTYATYLNGKTRWTVEARLPLTAIGAIGHPVVFHLARLGSYRPEGLAAAEAVQAEQIRRLSFDGPAAGASDADAAARPVISKPVPLTAIRTATPRY